MVRDTSLRRWLIASKVLLRSAATAAKASLLSMQFLQSSVICRHESTLFSGARAGQEQLLKIVRQ